MRYFHLIRAFVRQHPIRVLLTFGVSLAAQGVAVFLPIYIARSYDLLFGIQSQRARFLTFIPEDWLATFQGYFSLFLVVVFVRGLLDYGERYGIAILGELHLAFLRKKLFAHQLQTEMAIYDDKGTGKYLLRYSGDLTSIQAFINKGMIRFVSDLTLILLSLFVFFSLGGPIGWTVLGAIFVLTGITYLLDCKLYVASIKRRNAKSGLLKFVSARLQGLWTIKTFNRFVPEMGRFEKRVDKLLKLGKSYQQIVGVVGAIIPVGLYILIGMVMWVTHHLKTTSPNVVDPESFFIALLLLITLIPVFRRSFRVSIVWRNGSISYGKLADILILPKERGTITEKKLVWRQGQLTIKGISFAYPEQTNKVFPYLDLYIPCTSITWIQGPMGAGKTTLLKLLNGAYPVDSGEILIDDQDIQTIGIKELRRKIAVVDNQCTLLGNTVFQAVSYSRKAELRPRVQHVLDQLELSENLTLDFPIGEGGCRLSRGQYRLLLYARAFLTQKPILLIDEPFIYLDGPAERLVLSFLTRMRSTSTIVVFSARHHPTALKIDQNYMLPIPGSKVAHLRPA
jgi:ABC-type multidrug transport system fused ATPase/permease subunit